MPPPRRVANLRLISAGAGAIAATALLGRIFGQAVGLSEQTTHRLLMVSGVFLVGSIAAWFVGVEVRDRRGQRSRPCVHCGYDLRGNKSGTCPECGGLAHYKRSPR